MRVLIFGGSGMVGQGVLRECVGDGEISGSGFEIAATVDYLFGFAASTDAVSNHHFDQLFAAYLEDEGVRDFMANANPAALRETAARFAKAIRRGLWAPRSNRAGYLIAELLPEAQKEIA